MNNSRNNNRVSYNCMQCVLVMTRLPFFITYRVFFINQCKYPILHLCMIYICTVNISESSTDSVVECLVKRLFFFFYLPFNVDPLSICYFLYILHFKKSVPSVHRHAGSGRPTSAPWSLLAWQHSRSSMTASTHMLRAPMSSGTIHLWW